MNIYGKKVILRAIEPNDIAQLHRWANDPKLWTMLGGWHFPSSIEFVKEYYSKPDPLNQRFIIVNKEHGIIGTANLVDIDWKNNHAFHGMMLGHDNIRGKGYGVDTIMAIMRYAFDELHFERLDGSMIEYNKHSLHVYCEKLCWKEEGKLRNWYFRNNRYWDKILVGVTKMDYQNYISTNKYWDENE